MEEDIRKIAQEELAKQIRENIDSALIFSYVSTLEKQNKDLTRYLLNDNYIPRIKIEDKIKELKQKETLYRVNNQDYSMRMVQYQIVALQELLNDTKKEDN